MAVLAKKIAIIATSDGLLLRPSGTQDTRYDVRISYGTKKITKVSRTDEDAIFASSLDALGLFGLLDLVETSHLVAITRREHIASIRGKAIYAIRDVTLIPLTSQTEAEKVIANARNRLSKAADIVTEGDTDESDAEDDADTASAPSVHDEHGQQDATALEPPKAPLRKGMTSANEEIPNQGKGYGRFAQRWFTRDSSKGGISVKQGLQKEESSWDQNPKETRNAQRETSITAAAEDESQGNEGRTTAHEETTAVPAKDESTIASLKPRILRTARLYFSTSGFFFSYDYDLSGSLKQKSTLDSDLPLWKRFNSLCFWNKHLVDPFIDASLDELVLPLMQGFVGQRMFSIAKTDEKDHNTVGGTSQSAEDVVAEQATPSKTELLDDGKEKHEFVLTLISRRSIKRAGLRYLRRGVDDDGNAANAVETEQMLSPSTWDLAEKSFSVIQLRGSIPLHFTQNPGALKPTPIIIGSEATNQTAFKKHLSNAAKQYGDIQMVSLIDKHPPEVSIGEAFEHHSKLLNEAGGLDGKPVGFEWFDFHTVCKGMKFENVSILLDSLKDRLKTIGWITKQADRNIGLQTGVVRTNCMDCLDRTNVVQAAIGGWALEQQLNTMGLQVDLKKDPKTQWFNTLWADNGDAISKQYAGSAAMKGDFTRTRKRTWAGALSDFSLTMTRYYNNMFGDYFMQTCIDYFLGNASASVFDEFETEMMSKDYALDIRRIRLNAIDACVKIVLEDPSEHLIGGWTLSCPQKSNTLRTLPFEECVVLLTKVAFYFCRFEWDTDKVGSFEKVDLRDVAEIWRGAYITSALGGTHIDESKNCGFAMRYTSTSNSVVRRNTRSLQNEGDQEEENHGKGKSQNQAKQEENRMKVLAFKALPPTESAAKDEPGSEGMSEAQMVERVCTQLQQAIEVARQQEASKDGDEGKIVPQVEERDVISVADAKKSTGYVESIGYSLKRLVWS